MQTQESTFPVSKTALEAKCGPKSNMTKVTGAGTQEVLLSQGSERKPEATSVLSLMSDYLACSQDDKSHQRGLTAWRVPLKHIANVHFVCITPGGSCNYKILVI